MIRKILAITLIAMLFAGVSITEQPEETEAVSNFRLISFDGNKVEFEYTGTTDDDNGRDYVMIVFYGANGVITDTDEQSVNVGETEIDDDYCDPGSGFPFDPEPCRVEIYDTTNLDTNNPSELPAIFASPLLYASPIAQASPQIGTISISVAQAQPVYSSASGEIVKLDGADLYLPNDADGGGSDTYLVMSQVDVDGTTWYEIFIGNGLANVWVPSTNVTIVTFQ